VGTICWKCGKEVPPGAMACPACGAAVAGTGGQQAPSFAAAAPPPAAPSGGYSSPPPPPAAPAFQPAAPPPFQPSATPQQGFAPVQQGYSPAPPPPPASGIPQAAATSGGKGGSAVKIILIIVGVIFAIGLLIACVVGYGIYRVAHAVKEAAHGEKITIPGSNGSSISLPSAKSYSAEELGTDIYPGATPTQGGMKMNLPSGSWVQSVFLTSDSKDQVISFYKDKFGSDGSLMEAGEGAILTLKKGEKDSVVVTVTPGTGPGDDKTKIAIVHTVGK